MGSAGRFRHAPVGVLLATLAWTTPALALDRDERAFAIGVGYAHGGARRVGHGAGASLDVLFGLIDGLSWRIAYERALFVSGDADWRGLGRSTTLFAGVNYALDALRVVPFVEVGLGLSFYAGDPFPSRWDSGVQIGIGADYALNQLWSLGGFARYETMPLAVAGDTYIGDNPSQLLLGLRSTRRF